MFFTEEKESYIISTDKSRLNITIIHQYLSKESYWAKNIPLHTVQKCIEGSLCFGIYEANKQVAFARVITDYATFGYLADVFVLPESRGRGLSKWMMQCIMVHPYLQHFRKWMLGTRDAHGLYSQFGFRPLNNPERVMGFNAITGYDDNNSY
jgi:GNAT superfamily N-acetyltransferase